MNRPKKAQVNEYSRTWVELFLRDFDPAQTRREVDFLSRNLPLDRFPRILDICCGLGRHSGALAASGYDVMGVDRDAALIARASAAHPTAKFLALDMRELNRLNQPFEAALCLWQSFGYFDGETNERVIADIAALLCPGGRFILDIYHRGFYENAQGLRESEQNEVHIIENKRMIGDRLRVELEYHPGGTDTFEWQVFKANEIERVASRYGLKRTVSCTNFDERLEATATAPRMQIIFER